MGTVARASRGAVGSALAAWAVMGPAKSMLDGAVPTLRKQVVGAAVAGSVAAGAPWALREAVHAAIGHGTVRMLG